MYISVYTCMHSLPGGCSAAHHTHLHKGLYDAVDQFNVVLINVTVKVLQEESHLTHQVHIVDVVWLFTKVVLY